MREEFMMMRQGKQYVLFAGLLDEAHSRGLVGIDTELVQVPEEQNGQVAIVKATVQIEDAGSSGELRTFSGIGDASPQNVSRNIVPHLIRMAETRAKARALRDAVNVGATALEELSDGDDGPSSNSSSSSNSSNSSNAPQSSQGPRSAQGGPGKDGPGLREARERSGAGSRSEQGAGEEGTQNPARGPAQSERPGPRPVEESGEQIQEQSQEQSRERGGGSRAPKSQIDLIKTLAEEWRGEKGVERLESRIGKPLSELTRDEAEQWIDRLTPKEEADGQ